MTKQYRSGDYHRITLEAICAGESSLPEAAVFPQPSCREQYQRILALMEKGYIRPVKASGINGKNLLYKQINMKTFNLINIGERTGSGGPNIFNVWNDEGWEEPVIEERFDPDRTVLSLSFLKKQAKKTSDKKQAKIF